MMVRKLLLLALIGAITMGGFSCKSKKKLAKKEEKEAKERKIAKAKADLESILMDDGSMTIQEMENIIRAVKDAGIEDPEVKQLLAKAEQIVEERREEQMAEDRAERLAEEREKRRKSETSSKSLGDYFNDIANAPTTSSANTSINNALSLFKSEDVPVLIIIGTFGGEKDYDQPTTIKKYLNYLKDQGKNPNEIANVEYDGSGKIKLLELKK